MKKLILGLGIIGLIVLSCNKENKCDTLEIEYNKSIEIRDDYIKTLEENIKLKDSTIILQDMIIYKQSKIIEKYEQIYNFN